MRILLKPLSEGESVVAVPLGTQTESLQTLQEKERAEGVESWTEISKKLQKSRLTPKRHNYLPRKRTSVRTFTAYAAAPKVSLNFKPW